jgi:hypothetical protein
MPSARRPPNILEGAKLKLIKLNKKTMRTNPWSEEHPEIVAWAKANGCPDNQFGAQVERFG